MRYAYRTLGLIEDLLEAADQSGYTDRQLSMLSTESTDTVRNIRRGATPRLDTFEALCSALGLVLYIGRARPPPSDEAAHSPSATDSAIPCHLLHVFRVIADSLRGVGCEVREPDSWRRRQDD